MQRTTAARAVSLVALVISLTAAWQAVRFCQGNIGAPVFDQLYAFIQEATGNTGTAAPDLSRLSYWLGRLYYYLGGILTWLGIAAFVATGGKAAARIVEVGFDQYRAERREAIQEAQRLAEIEAARERRRELRRKRIEMLQPKVPSFSFGSFLLGLSIGMFFF